MQDDKQYLIIGGSTKCGTTSLFNYFEFHPGVCSCSMKESRYFLEPDYKLLAARRDHTMHPVFGSLFESCHAGLIRMEATPDYLYSEHALRRIANEIPNVKLVFILRSPVGRFVSWFKYSKQLGLIDEQTSLSQYLEMQSTATDGLQHLRALEQGRYSEYLNKAYEIFDTKQILVCFYEELVADPKALCEKICRFANLDSDYFNGYQFKVYNKSSTGKASMSSRIFKKFKRLLKPVKQRLPKVIRKKLKLAALQIDTVLAKTDDDNPSKFQHSSETSDRLYNYYADEAKRIDQLTGLLPPWSR